MKKHLLSALGCLACVLALAAALPLVRGVVEMMAEMLI